MELHTLAPALGAKTKRKRIGRGQGSGKGGTAGKGHNGAQARSGYKTRPHFVGGQLPLQRSVGKRGFNSHKKVVAQLITLDDLQKLATKAKLAKITPELLVKHHLVKPGVPFKILKVGKLLKKIDVVAHKISLSAQKTIEQLGGTVTTTP